MTRAHAGHTPRALRSGAALALTLALLPATTPPAHAADDTCTGPHLIDQASPTLARLQVSQAHALSTGSGVVVAVIDSGIDATNPHLGAAVLPGIDLVDDTSTTPGEVDLDGHGTAVAGIIAARTFPGSAVEGLAPDARLLPVRVYSQNTDDARKAGTGPTSDRIAAGIRAAADAGAVIANVSLSSTEDVPVIADAVAYAHDHGMLIVASAGNRASSESETDGPRYPAAYPGVLAVAALDADGRPADQSIHGPHVDIAAPGAQVVTTTTGGIDCIYATDSAESSFATAYVSGAAALVAAAHPQESPDQWAYRLTATAARARLDSRDDQAGWGTVQPFAALTLVPGPGTRGGERPDGAPTTSAAPHQAAPLVIVRPPDPWQDARAVGAAIGVLGPALVLIALLLGRARTRRDRGPDAATPTASA
ncbi:S8 family serine peptidase [Xylanimonas allomyrinae]|uniref:S8 family serine peptidase n=1 Tax=Xylanimonas allomyrinae TaxID=2509459 RepID=UPI0013A677F2|nr:S8 family serine peptidase [Xylanimonas allomyrinae]